MKTVYDKYCVYFTLFLNNLKYEEEAYASFVDYNMEFQKQAGDLINAHYDFSAEKMEGIKRNILHAQDIPEEEYEELKESYYRYYFYYNAILDTHFYDYVSKKLDFWQKKYIEKSSKYGDFSEVNFIDKKIYTWG